MILKMILKSFDFQCDFDFQITTSKMILILNHLYPSDLILILKLSTYSSFNSRVAKFKITNFSGEHFFMLKKTVNIQ